MASRAVDAEEHAQRDRGPRGKRLTALEAFLFVFVFVFQGKKKDHRNGKV